MIAGRLNSASAEGRALRARANVLWFQGQPRVAVEYFDRAVSAFRRSDNSEEVGRTLSSSIPSLALTGNYERAHSVAAEARAIFHQQNDSARLARLELNVGNIHHRQDRLADALSCYAHAYGLLLRYEDHEGTGAALHNMAVCFIGLDDFGRALAAYERLHSFCVVHKMPLLAVQADYNIAYLHYMRGDYQRALDGLLVVREACRKSGDRYHAALCDLDESEIYLELNLPGTAEDVARQARAQFEALGLRHEAARAAVNLFVAQSSHRQPAFDVLTEAREIFEQEQSEAWVAHVDLYHAAALVEAGNPREALRLCESALSVFERTGALRKVAISRLLLARIHFREGRLRTALRLCNRVLRYLSSLDAPMLKYKTLLLFGRIREAASEHGKAYRVYEAARREIEKLGTSLHHEELKIGFLINGAPVYERLVEVCLKQGTGSGAAAAFQHMEQAKCRCLAELMLGRGRPLRSNQQRSFRPAAHKARQDLDWCYERMEAAELRGGLSSRAVLAALRKTARQREDELVRMVRELPSAANDRGFRGCPELSAEEIRTALDPDETLIEYHSSGDQLLAAIVTRKEVRVLPAGRLSTVADRLRMLQYQLSKLRLGPSYCRTFEDSLTAAVTAHLQAIHAQVLSPLCGRLQGRHLVIVPHALLHRVPFHALFDGSHHLIDQFTVTYAPSAAIHALCRRRAVNADGPNLIMGIENSNAPLIRSEVELVSGSVPKPLVRLGQDANYKTLRELGAYSRSIHIATHGQFRPDNPLFSSIRLADSFLSLFDLYELALPVELLTLSGCGTGLNVVAPNDEILGLTRGLLYAGARSVLVTLWDVDDRSTAQFMASFYNHLRTVGDKRIAVRRAMLALRERNAHPYHWAPYLLVGGG
jgi:CHAT domain-containing protein/tetratricopeptide (TPR) repeat protein